RVVYIGSERVDDVTRHPAFRNAAATVAALYDMKADPANREAMSYEEDGGRHSIYFLRPRTREDLQRRMLGHRRIADLTFGMFGRSPDHVASFVTGMVIKPDALPAPCAHADNLLRYYRVRFPARLALRRERQHRSVRQRQGAVGESIRARRCRALARHLHQDAEPLLRQSPVECALLVEDASPTRSLQQDRAGDRRRSGPCRQGDAWQDGGGREHDRR